MKMDKETMKELMLSQLLGYKLGKEGFSITELVSGAGLTIDEWDDMQDESDITSLCDSDRKEIEEYLKSKLNLEVKR